MNRHPPFGNQISEAVSKVPNYSVTVEQVNICTIIMLCAYPYIQSSYYIP